MYTHQLLRIPFNNKEILLYAPTLGKVWKIPTLKDIGINTVMSDKSVIQTKPHVDLTFLISFNCTLACIYCYESHSIGLGSLSIDKAKSIALPLLEKHRNDTDRFVVNFFGGEPTLFPKFLQDISAWIRTWGLKNSKRTATSITTNGLLPPRKIPLLWQIADRVKVSFDGLRKVQDMHRPTIKGKSSYDRILHVIDQLANDYPKRLTLRLTVTAFSVPYLEETAEFLCHRYPGIPQQYEPAMDSCFAVQGVADFSMQSFVSQLVRAYKIGLLHNTPIGTSFARISRFNSDINRFCGVSSMKYTILPDGNIASCNRVHTSTVRSTPFYLGNVKDVINGKRPKFTLPIVCNDCYARFACKGGCYALRHSLGINKDDGFSFCDEIRRLLREILILQTNRKEVKNCDSAESDIATG
ncbi:MAG: radical SAM protein [Patescibacteria group bacterium]